MKERRKLAEGRQRNGGNSEQSSNRSARNNLSPLPDHFGNFVSFLKSDDAPLWVAYDASSYVSVLDGFHQFSVLDSP